MLPAPIVLPRLHLPDWAGMVVRGLRALWSEDAWFEGGGMSAVPFAADRWLGVRW